MKYDMTGKRFARVVALRQAGSASSGDLKWEFLCDCGRTFEANGYYVRSGKVKDCPVCARLRTTAASVKHGKSDSAEFRIWTGMHTRCDNKKANSYAEYGGRGITICARWRESFEVFLADMGPRPSPVHSVERSDTNGNYEPSNCHWATPSEQANNKRNNLRVEINGEEKTLAQWADKYGVERSTVWLRHKNGVRGLALFSSTVRRIEHDGVSDTVAGWSKRVGIRANTINMRLNCYGWPVARALSEGASL